MAIHLVKLCVGATSIADLAHWQDKRVAAQKAEGAARPLPFHVTRNAPRRADELQEGGSLYWVIQRLIQVRQRIAGFEEARGPDGVKCRILLDPELVETQLAPRKAFQGWRYLTPEDAPADAPARHSADTDMPLALRRELISIGAW